MGAKLNHYYITSMLWIAEQFHRVGHFFCNLAIDRMDITTRNLAKELDQWITKEVKTSKTEEVTNVDPRLH